MCNQGSLRHGVKIVAFSSVLIGIGICGLSSWMLHKALQMKNNYELNGKEFLMHANNFFNGVGGNSGPSQYDYDIVFRILITNSATALAGGVLQLLFSLALFLATIQGGSRSQFIGKLWVYCHIVVMLVLGAATLCILTNELHINTAITVFLISTGADALLLLFFMWMVYSWAFSDAEEEIDEIKSRRGSQIVHGYHQPPGYTTMNPPLPGGNNNGKMVENFREVQLRPVSVV